MVGGFTVGPRYVLRAYAQELGMKKSGCDVAGMAKKFEDIKSAAKLAAASKKAALKQRTDMGVSWSEEWCLAGSSYFGAEGEHIRKFYRLPPVSVFF